MVWQVQMAEVSVAALQLLMMMGKVDFIDADYLGMVDIVLSQ